MGLRLLAISSLLVSVSIAGCTKGTGLTNNNANNKAPTPGPTSTPDPLAAPRALFIKNCKECHGETGEGGPVKLEDGTRLKVPSLRTGHALRHPDSDFVKQITKGGDGMPAFADKLTAQEIDELVRFIRQEFQGGMTPPAEPMKGMKGMK